MAHANTPAPYVACLLRMAMAGPGFAQLSHPDPDDRAGPVLTTAPRSRPDGLPQLQARRQSLLTEARRLRNLRRSKDASICEAELRRVTHEILKEGPRA